MPAAKTALITGASSGLGAEFARQLAAMDCNLILVARREDRLHAVRDEILRQHHVDVRIMPADLGITDAARILHDKIKTAGLKVDILINNAGFGAFGEHMQIPWQREQQMLMLDIVTLMQLTKLFADDMLAGGGGYILQVSSIAAYQPTPGYAAYGAAKSSVLNFGEAFNYELRGTDTSCTVLSPGVTATEFLQVAGQKPTLYQRLLMMQSHEVVRIGLKAMFRRRSSVIPGWLNAGMAWSNRLMPRRWSAAIAYRLMTLG
ncbi:MAG TPA: SDR family oxidoreductase [Gammaproteobacteria bacterium]|jgi:short-subunit dehydrogenase|nr:SDR family oxidoreductase [Gammaproteobacteria bacterium]